MNANDLSNEIGKHVWWQWCAHPPAGQLIGCLQPRPTGFLSGDLDLDTIYMTLVVFIILTILALIARRNMSVTRPTGVQNLLEMTMEFINGFVADSLDSVLGALIAPLVITFFMFLLLANWIGLVPIPAIALGGLNLPAFHSPTADLNTTVAYALIVFVVVHTLSIRKRGGGGYIAHYFQPFGPFVVINIIEEISKPVTLAFRLFGNILSGEVLILVFAVLLPWWALPIPHIAALALGLFVGTIQAFVFTMLTIAYVGIGTTVEGH